MTHHVNILKKYIKNINFFYYIIFTSILQIIISYIFGIVAEFLNINDALKGVDFSKLSNLEIFTIAVIIIPLIETLIFQYFIINIWIYTKKNIYIGIFLSSMFFAISHAYNIIYVINMFIMGLILAYSFVLSKNRKWKAFWVVYSIHSLYNFFVFLYRIINEIL